MKNLYGIQYLLVIVGAVGILLANKGFTGAFIGSPGVSSLLATIVCGVFVFVGLSLIIMNKD